jgi:hypothetical protein
MDAATADSLFRKKLVTPNGFGSWPPEKQTSYLQNTLRAAQKAGALEVVTETQNQINSIALNNVRESTAAKNNAGVQLDLTKVWKLKTEDPREFNAKLQESYAGINAGLQKAQISASTRMQIANASSADRMQIAQWHIAAQLAGYDENNAWRAAIAQYQQNNMNARTNAEDDTKVIDSTGGAGGLPPQVGGNTTVVVPDEASGTARLIEQIRALTGKNVGGGSGGGNTGGGGGGGGGAQLPAVTPATTAQMKAAVAARGLPAVKQHLMQTYGISSSAADQYLRSYGITTSVQPPPVFNRGAANGVGSF